MLLTYLYTNFFEQTPFADACGISQAACGKLVDDRLIPAASYVYDARGRSVSFVSAHEDAQQYRFHLKGHVGWVQTLRRMGITEEDQARRYFFERYSAAQDAFLASQLGRALCTYAPDVPARFNPDYAQDTWQNFLAGVYGVCTTDGQPETIFLKQAGVLFIEALKSGGPGKTHGKKLALLANAVNFLDAVESQFAPHEAASTSRQRCITDVRNLFLAGTDGPIR